VVFPFRPGEQASGNSARTRRYNDTRGVRSFVAAAAQMTSEGLGFSRAVKDAPLTSEGLG